MMKFVGYVSVLGLFSWSVFAGELRSFERKYEGYPKSEKGCHLTAKELGEAFQAGSAAQDVVGRCLGESSLGYSIGVRYLAEAPVALVSTIAKWDTLGRHTPYKTFESCEAALAGEVSVFEAETKLKASIAFCSADDPWDNLGYEAWIDAFGNSARGPFVSEFYYFTIPIGLKGSELAALIRKGIEGLGAIPRHVTFRSTGGNGIASVSYYHESKIQLDVTEPTRNAKADDCALELADFNSFSALLKPAPIAAYCGKSMVGLAEVTFITAGEIRFKVSQSIEIFESFAQCREKKAELLRYYRETLKRPVLGGLCTRDEEDRKHKLSLFE